MRSAPVSPDADPVEAHLAEVAWLLDDHDRTMGRIARLLVSVQADGRLPERLGGMSLQVWLEHTGRLPGADARALLGCIDVLARMPRLLDGLCDRWLSWAQTERICTAARQVRVGQLDQLDRLVADAMIAQGDFLALTPRLFGGGAIYGEYGPVGFATLAETLDAPLGPPPTVPDLDDPDAVDEALQTLDEQRRMLARDHGAAMAQRLLDVCERELADIHGPDTDNGRRARPLLLATVDLEALLDDVGDIVGVGRRSYVAPGWLRRAIWARDLTVADPDGSTPVRRDLDHLLEWPHGPTDVDNLVPLGRRWHNLKTSKRWTLARARDGTVTWTHRRHGWKLRLAPPRRDLADPPDTGPPRLPLDLTGLDPPPHRLAHTA